MRSLLLAIGDGIIRRMNVTKTRCFLTALLQLTCAGAAADQALVAVASNFTSTARLLEQAFEASSRHQIDLTFGSTGQLYAQVRFGAPYDLLLAADQRRPQMLESSGHVVHDSRFTYATGQLVLVGPHTAHSDARARLEDESLMRLAMANPEVAPYGLASREFLESSRLASRLQSKIVLGENVAQAFAMLATGNVDVALVGASQVLGRQDLEVWPIAADAHAPIHQDAVLLAHGRDNLAALAFHRYLRSERGRAIIAAQGYRLTGE